MSSWPDARYGVREGELFAGKYRIDRLLGAGGMGIVVLAHHVELDDRVAIKFLLPEALTNGEAVARFLREAQAAVKIKSEHVARNPFTISTGAEGDNCSLPFAPLSGRITGTPDTNACEPNIYPNGELTPTGPHTVCCQ